MILCHCWQISKNTYHGETRRPCTEGDANETEESTSNRSKTTATYTELTLVESYEWEKSKHNHCLEWTFVLVHFFLQSSVGKRENFPRVSFIFVQYYNGTVFFFFLRWRKELKHTAEQCKNVKVYQLTIILLPGRKKKIDHHLTEPVIQFLSHPWTLERWRSTREQDVAKALWPGSKMSVTELHPICSAVYN